MHSRQIKKIQKLLEFWKSSQPLNERLQRNIDQSFMIDFNYNSNHLEGNTLTYGQTKLLLLFGRVVFTEQIITGKIREIEETGKKQQNVTVNVSVNEGKNVTVKDNIIDMMRQKPNITVSEMANILSVEKRTIYRNLEKLKSSGLLVRVGADKNGYWKITGLNL
jgi:Fic family protein